jgi:hypothetical protein
MAGGGGWGGSGGVGGGGGGGDGGGRGRGGGGGDGGGERGRLLVWWHFLLPTYSLCRGSPEPALVRIVPTPLSPARSSSSHLAPPSFFPCHYLPSSPSSYSSVPCPTPFLSAPFLFICYVSISRALLSPSLFRHAPSPLAPTPYLSFSRLPSASSPGFFKSVSLTPLFSCPPPSRSSFYCPSPEQLYSLFTSLIPVSPLLAPLRMYHYRLYQFPARPSLSIRDPAARFSVPCSLLAHFRLPRNA